MAYTPQLPVEVANTTSASTMVNSRATVVGFVVTESTVAGSIEFKDGGSSGTSKGIFKTGASGRMVPVPVPASGILFQTSVYAAPTTNVAGLSIFYLPGTT